MMNNKQQVMFEKKKQDNTLRDPWDLENWRVAWTSPPLDRHHAFSDEEDEDEENKEIESEKKSV